MGSHDSILQVGDRVWRVVNRVFPSNTYICATGDPKGCFLVDPGTDPETIEEALVTLGLKPCHVFCTHGHFDHAGSAAYFQGKYDVNCYLHGADLKTLRGSNFLLMAFKIPFIMKQPRVLEAVEFIKALPEQKICIYPAPGHTPGSCILGYEKTLFTGDTLYSYGVGLSKLPGENADLLKASLLSLWDQLPSEALVLPGHGEGSPFINIKSNNEPLLNFLGLIETPFGGS